MKFRTIIIEDEEVSRNALKQMINEVPWLQSVGEVGTVRKAIEAIEQLDPDVIFLDMKIPGGTGLDILKQLATVPYIIFTTAYSEYAVDAFNHNAVDYLLKPFSRRRFNQAIEKLHRRLLEQSDEDDVNTSRIFIRSGLQIFPLLLDRVEYFAADKDYVIAHIGKEERLLTATLAALELQLDSERFIRIHRSYIVNTHLIKSMRKYGDRQLKLTMNNNSEIVSSRAGTAKLKHLIK